MKRVLVVLAGVVLFFMLAVDIYLRLSPSRESRPATPSPAPTRSPSPSPFPTVEPTPSPAPTPEATQPPPETVVELPRPKPPARPRARRTPARPAPSTAALMAEADAALAAKNYVRAGELYEQVLGLEPSNARAAAGRTEVQAELASRRTFVPGETTFQTGGSTAESGSESQPEVPAGFDPGGVAVKAAPKVPALIEFDVQPPRMRPGMPYTVRVYLRNHGKKGIKIRELRLASVLNGSRSESIVTPKIKEVPPQLSALLAEVPSVWKEGVRGWGMEVTIRSGHGDVYRNSVSWR